jgi:hypothetical protein
MLNDIEKLLEESSRDLPSKQSMPTWSDPTTKFTGQKPDLGEDIIFRERVKYGLTAPIFKDGKWLLSDTSDISREQFGDEALAFTIGEGSKGWGERSIQADKRLIDQFNNEGNSMFDGGNRETAHTEQFFEGFNFFGDENETYKTADEIKKKIEYVDPNWTDDKRFTALTEWQEANPEVNRYLATAGVNVQDYILNTRNSDAFMFAINEAIQRANIDIRMRLYETDNGTISKIGNAVVEGIKDPLLVRDIILSSIATLGVGGIATVAGLSARALAGGVATGVNAARAVKGLEMVRKAANTAALATGPMTGLIEGPAYAAIRTFVPSAGRSAVSTLSSRVLAVALEGGISGAVSSYADQKASHEWRSLVFQDTDKAFKYNLGETAMGALTGALGSVGLAATFRFGLGAVGDYKYYKTGDWDGFRRQIANSMDTWATTKDGDIVWGNTLSDGRGVFFGDVVDNIMKKHDGRDFTNVMLNGSRLFGTFNQRIAGKMNLDINKALPIIEEFEKATGVAGEAAMLRVNGVAPETRRLFDMILSESNLDDADLSLDDVTALLKDYNANRSGELFGPREVTAADVTLAKLEPATEQVEVARQIQRLVGARSLDRKLETIGVSSSNVINNAEKLLGRDLNLADDVDFGNFITAAKFAAASVDEAQVVSTMKRITSGDFGGGRTIPQEVVQSIFKSAFGDKPIVVTASGTNKNFAVVVDPKTGEVFASGRTLKTGKNGNLEIELRADDATSKFFTDDTTTVDTETFKAKLVEVNEKLNEAWSKGVKEKVKKVIDSVKKPKAKEKLAATFAEGKEVTVDNIKDVFDLTKSEAVAAKIIFDTLGYEGDSGMLRIARFAADDRNAEIVLEGSTALIKATKSADLGTVTHEMSHYLQIMVLDNLDAEARHAIGITDDMWTKFKDWVGFTGDEWSEAAAEKFANGMSQYVRRVMSGDGRAPTTQIQRLFHRVGDHLGKIGDRFKTQEALEAGLTMSAEAEAVFEALFNRSNSKVGELFDAAYQNLFKRLPKEQRHAIGKEILGEMAFNDYLAKQEIKTEKAKRVVDPLAIAASVKTESTTSIINSIYEGINKSVTRKHIKEAITVAGYTKEEYIADVNKLRDMVIGQTSVTSTKPARLDSASHLSDDELADFYTQLFEAGGVDESMEYIGVVIDFDVRLGVLGAGRDLSTLEELGGKLPENPKWGLTPRNEKKKFYSKTALLKEINTRRDAGISKTEKSIAVSSETLQSIDELLAETGFVDNAGLSVSLTPTEAIVATRMAEASQASRNAVAHMETVITALNEDRPLDAAKAKKTETVAPEVVNVEDRPVDMRDGLSNLGTIAEASRVETERLGGLIPEAHTKEAKAIAAAVVADPARAEKILDEYQELLLTIESGTRELTKQYIAAELRARISSVTIEHITGMDDKAFKRFTELNELYKRIENTQNEQAIEMVIRDPSRENINNAVRVLGWSESDVSLYAVGRYQLTNGSLVAEFIDAKRYVEANINTVKENITKLKEREDEYKSAVAKRDVAKRGEVVLTKEESDKLDAFISEYDKMKYSVSRFNNAAERVKRGVLRPESVDIIDADMKLKADAPEIKTEWLKIPNLDRSPKLVKLIYAKIDQADPVKILRVLDEKIETLSDKVAFDGESSLPNWSAMSPIEKAQAWARGDAKSAAASAFVKTVINGEESNAKRKGKTKKGITGDVEAPEGRGDSLVDTGTATKARETKEDSRDFYYNLEEEVGSIRYVSNLFYHYLLDIGKDELAKVFMARKEAMMYKGSKIESTTRILENYGITMTEGTLDNRITSLASEFETFTSMLPEGQAEGLKKAFKLRRGKSKTLAQSKVVGEMTDEQLDELDALLNTMQPGDMIQAPDFLIKTVTESSSNLYRKIASGEIETVGAAIREIANSKTSKFAALAELLLSEKQDILDGMGLHLAIYAKDDFTGGAFAGNNVFLNAREGKVNVTTLIHETIHAITANDLDSYGFIESGADSYIKQLNDALSSGKGPNGKQISDGARSIIKAYLNSLKWVDETPMALDILGTDYKSRLVGQNAVDPETSTHYALSNIHEFVAVVLTDVSAVKFFGAIPAENVAESRPVKEMLFGVAKTLWPQGKDLEIQRRADFLRKQVLADLAAGALASKVDVPDPLDALLPPLMPGTTPFKLIGTELVKTEGVDMAGLLRANLKAAKGRVYAQLRAVNLQEQFAEAAKAAGADAAAFEAKLSELVDSAEVRRRNLLAAGLHEEMEPEDLEIIQSMINGTKAFTQPATTHLTKRMKSAVTPSTMPTKFIGKSYRDLTDDERRDFVSTVLLPTVESKMGRRNRSAGLYSMITDSKVGKSVNSLIGGGAAYGDTADADSLLLQFFSKVYDPLMDLRDGELSGVFDLFSVDLVNAETNNMYSRAGLLNIQRKIMAQVSRTPDLEKLYETAWMYLGNLEELPEGIAHRELIVELIKGVHKYNTIVGDILKKYGTLDEAMDPSKYGTIHKVNMLAFEEQERFVEALVKHALIKERESKELSIVTMDAMGWVKLTRDSVSDDIKSVSIPEESPLKSVFEEKEYGYSGFKRIALKSSISVDLLKLYEEGLTSAKNYKNWDIYKSRGDGYTAIRHTMTVAKNRYLDIESAESRGGKPRTEGVGGGRDMDITRILSHEEITKNPELARYFDKDIFGLINQQLRSSVTDAIMTKYISEMFGVKMSWLDLIEVSRKHGEASRGQLTKSEQDSVNRGYDRIKTIWEANTGKMLASRDGLDRHYRSLLETGSRPLVLAASGLRAAVTSTGETVRAILSSNHNRGMLRQVLPNFITTLKLFSRNKRQTIQQIASSTHWIRGLSSDHLLLRAEMNPNNPFGGTIMGATQGGWFKRWASAWQGVKERNKLEDSIVGKAANYLSVPASKLGSPLAFINDVTTTLHVYNLQNNLTNNSSKFLALAKLLQESEPESVAEFKELARRAGLSTKEAIDLSSMGLLDPKRIEVMIEAAKDQTNYMEGMLDVQRLYIWAGEDPVKIDTINRMGSLINATARHTNTDPTLLDLRINQSAYARSMGVFMQFLLSHSAQEIGRRRRYTTTAYSKHLAGLVMMESIAYSLARTKDDDDDKWIWEDTKEKPFQTVVKLGTSLPLLGSYQYLSALLRAGILETHSQLTGEKSDERFRAPDLYSGPSENIPRRTVDMIKDLL